MRLLGAVGEMLEDQALIVWPENHAAWQFFCRVSDQWRMGPSGPVALDLMPVFHELDRHGLTGEEYDEMLSDIRVLAGAALEQIHEKDE